MGDFSDALQQHTRLADRVRFSKTLLLKVRSAASNRPGCSRSDVCVYAAGSLGRLETGKASDLDVFLFADRESREPNERSLTRLEEIVVLSELIQVNAGLQLPPFSGVGEFFKIHEVADLLAGTGSATDDSENLFTTRLLLLLESKCVANDDLYVSATKRVVDMYFRDGVGRKGYRPLFLLNDMLRYWRTLCLNYERTRHDKRKPWWKKNLNLKFSRKLTVFSSVLAVLVDHIDTYDKFEPIFSLTPLERMALALDNLDTTSLLPIFRQFLDNYEEFLAAKSHAELEVLDETSSAKFAQSSQDFDNFLHAAFASPNLDRQLVRYLLI